MLKKPKIRPLRLTIVGKSHVGKSCVTLFYNRRIFYDDSHEGLYPTIGADYDTKTVHYKDVEYRLTIWDTAGAAEFECLTLSYIRGCDMLIMIYDITNRESFDILLSKIARFVTKWDIPFCVVGNKIDLESKREVSEEEGNSVEGSLFFLETSCKIGHNIDALFDKIIEYCHNNGDVAKNVDTVVSHVAAKKELIQLFLDGQLKSICLSSLPSELKNISAQDALRNCTKSGYVQTKWLWISLNRFLVLKGDYLYWFRRNTSRDPVAFLDLRNCVSLSGEEERNSFSIVYSKTAGNSLDTNCITFQCVNTADEEDSISWKLDLLNQLAKSTENVPIRKACFGALTKMKLGRTERAIIKIRQNDESLYRLSFKSQNKLDMRIGFTSLGFSFEEHNFKFSTDASRSEYVFFIKDLAVVCFKPRDTESYNSAGSQLKKIFGVQSFGGRITEKSCLEIFDLAYRCACFEMSISGIESLKDSLIHHWTKCETFKEINLRGYQMINQDIFAISHALSHYHFISTICLRNCGIDSKGLSIFLKSLTDYNALKCLDIGMNKHIDSNETGKCFEEFLKTCKLETLKLMSCDIGSVTFSTFLPVIKEHETLEEIDLSFNDVDDSLCEPISEIISKNNRLAKLVLWHSCLTEEPATKLYGALEKRSKIFPKLEISLHHSQFISNDTITLFDTFLEKVEKEEEEEEVEVGDVCETIKIKSNKSENETNSSAKDMNDFLDVDNIKLEVGEENTFTLKEMLVDVMLTQQIILKRQVLQYQKQMEHFQLSINMVQIRTPRTFCILPSPEDKSWKKTSSWGKETFRLHLLCEGSEGGSVGDIHFLQDHKGYLIEQPTEFLKKVLPVLTIGMKVLSTAAKIAGTAIGAGGLVPSGDVLKTLGIVSQKSGDIAALLQKVQESIKECNHHDVENPEIQVSTGAALRSLEVFLNENDELRHFGGLQSVAGPDGRWAWVCDQHAKF
ncbi:uncharacterized protein [Clytia hemisphaerica]